MKLPRVLIAGERSGTGKTTVATGVMGALVKAGYRVQPFKVGPDYIDPGYHSKVTGRNSRNIDIWLTSKKAVVESLAEASGDADIAVIEGAMGLYDGISGEGYKGSSADIAEITSTPVVLVIDSAKLGYSAGAIFKGYKDFGTVNIKGVIVNNIGSKSHEEIIRHSIDKAGGEILGIIPRDSSVSLPERYLGLIPALEQEEFSDIIERISKLVEENVALDRIIEIASSAKELPSIPSEEKKDNSVRIAVAKDSAFSFYYWDNIDLLKKHGAEIIFFSPLNETPPDCDGIYIGGGFPEVFRQELSSNKKALRRIKSLFEDEMPIYAECGGLMYLCRNIISEGKSFRMAGVFDAEVEMTEKLQALKYTLARVDLDNIYLKKGSFVKGHEFHYSRIIDIAEDVKFLYTLQKGAGIKDFRDGLYDKNTLAGYMHIHFRGVEKFPGNFVKACLKYRRK
ncbi:MAG TPA: hydrogenobyrinic acid a,c-diamide synthase (glutamine-hydrolyzing) [Euryarchaeota archaeon]|nr:hydrogenobyrinic acid a,c-diamide synthase (glutamine-hydrolyzing) [Euryarchaeota archaeon]